ncbi:MAG: hypothetical protein HKN97_09715 [Myxococcales bacterium]|nr:hypothetical protein [Deltaproteobacteria bacterium]NND28855.1 hypothetical protein [Myxococcales bacterium]
MDRFHRALPILRALIAAAVATTPGCASNHGHLYAAGAVASTTWAAHVDHPIARDYLEGRPLPLDVQGIRDAYVSSGAPPTEQALTYLTTRYSPDVATLLFAEAMSAHEPSEAIQREYAAAVDRLLGSGEPTELDLSSSQLTVAFAPGWFYKSYGAETGADFQRQLAQLERVGVPGVLIETDENGTVESNAVMIADALRRLRREGREVLVVSGSKSGAEVALALGEVLQPEETSGVRAWLSIGGVHQGSPFADWALNPTVCWISQLNLGLQGFDLEGAMSLQTDRRRAQFANLRFPDHMLLVSYVPVPLSGDISARGAFGYSRMRHLGPNDGLTMLVDQLLPGGLTIVEPGVDHYFDHEDRELRSLALLEVLLKRLGVSEGCGSCLAASTAR